MSLLGRAALKDVTVVSSGWLEFTLQELTVATVMERRARELPEKVFIRNVDGPVMTFREVHEYTNRIVNWLAELGLRKSDHVGVMMENHPECLLSHLALAKAGAVSVPINVNAEGDLLIHYLDFADVGTLIVTSDLCHRISQIADRLPKLLTLVVVGEIPSDDAFSHMRVVSFDEYRFASAQTPVSDVKFSDLAFILFTSGTTGPSKGVMFTQARAFLWDEGMVTQLGVSATDTYFVCTPLSHASGLLGGAWMMLALGATVAVTKRFSASAFLDQCRQTGSTYASLLGAMLPFVEAVPARDDDHLNPLRMISAGPYPKTWQSFEARFGLDLVSGYGLSDHSSCTKLMPGAPAQKRGSAGKVIPPFEMLIVDEHDVPVRPGVKGEILLRSTQAWHSSSGYYKLPEKTVEAWRNEWFHTGDRGILDEDGYFWFVDRAKDSIRYRGENISAFEVEQLILRYEHVAQVAAYPLPAEFSEDEVAISVVVREASRVSADDLMAYCEANMPRYMRPRYIDIRNELPLNLNGRVEKYKLIEWCTGNRGSIWDREGSTRYKVNRR